MKRSMLLGTTFSLTLLFTGIVQADDPVVERAIKTLADPDLAEATKVKAAQELIPLKEKAAPAIPKLAQSVNDPKLSKNGRQSLIKVMEGLGKPAVPQLATLLKNNASPISPDNWIATRAAYALGQIGSDAKEAASTLVLAIKADPFQADAYFGYLNKIGGGDPKEVVPAAIEQIKISLNPPKTGKLALGSPTPWNAFESIAKAGPAAKATVPFLIELVKQANTNAFKKYQQEAIVALGGIGPDAATALPVIRSLLQKHGKYAEEAIAKIKENK